MNLFARVVKNPLFSCVLIGIGIVPSLAFGLYFYNQDKHLNELQQRLEAAYKKSIIQKTRQEKENVFFSKIKNSDHFYIDKYLETSLFLEPEIKKLEAVAYASSQSDADKRRLAFLKDGLNALRFSEEKIRKNEKVQEVEEKQQHSVEMNQEDLKKLLSLIEGTQIETYHPQPARPQLIISYFDLSKKAISSEEEVFVVNIQLIKRENIPLNN